MARILFNHCTPAPNKITGLTIYAWKILQALAQRGKHQYVLVTNWSADRLPQFIMQLGLETITLPNFKNETLAVLSNTIRLPRLATRHGCEAMLHPQPVSMAAGMDRSVVVIHDLYRVTDPQLFAWRQRMQWQHITARGFRRAARLISVSHATANALGAAYPETKGNIRVVHEASPVDLSARPPAPSRFAGEPYALMVANITPTKNVDVIVPALELLARQGCSPHVVLVGQGQSAILEQAASRTDIRLTLLSGLSEEELQSLYFHARVFINTSRVEGFCLPILEAQTFGVPVICSDLPVLREVAGDGACFVPPDDPTALARAITTLFGDASLQAQLREKAQENASRFSWSRAARETEAVLDEVLELGR